MDASANGDPDREAAETLRDLVERWWARGGSEKREAARALLERLLQDREAAAGELMVPIPAAGTVEYGLLRWQLEDVRAEAARLRAEREKLVAGCRAAYNQWECCDVMVVLREALRSVGEDVSTEG